METGARQILGAWANKRSPEELLADAIHMYRLLIRDDMEAAHFTQPGLVMLEEIGVSAKPDNVGLAGLVTALSASAPKLRLNDVRARLVGELAGEAGRRWPAERASHMSSFSRAVQLIAAFVKRRNDANSKQATN